MNPSIGGWVMDTRKKCIPQWMDVLIYTVFFGDCVSHPGIKKSESKYFCIDCIHSLCYHCLSPHLHHRCLQIRKYMHADCINLKDMKTVMDCSQLRRYKTNNEKVLYIRPRIGSDSTMDHLKNFVWRECPNCERNSKNLYCSIACKVAAIYEGRDDNETGDSPDDKEKANHRRKGTPLRSPLF